MAFHSDATVGDNQIDGQLSRFPSSRYMGSKQAILPFLHSVFRELEFDTVLDAFSGSAVVSYLLKCMGKSVTSNDFLTFCYHTARACVANSNLFLSEDIVSRILQPHHQADDFIRRNFSGLYFTDEENYLLDNMTAHIRDLGSGYEQSIAYAALTRACLRKRPRGLFTYTGIRYDDGRRDLLKSFEQQFRDAVNIFNLAVFENGKKNQAFNNSVFLLPENAHYDLVYIDPPYVSPHSDNDYTRRYHFLEGLTRYWEGLEINLNTSTRKFNRIPSLFDSKLTVFHGFEKLFERYKESKIVVSYSSNGIPNKDELRSMLQKYKAKVDVFEYAHLYSSGTHSHKVGNNQNAVKEFLFVGR